MDEIDILRCATLLLKNYGPEDGIHRATLRADALLDQGDLEGQRVWLRVIEAIREFSRVERSGTEAIH